MELRMLGPLELWAADGPVDLGPPRQRAVWAALAVDAPRPVPADTIAGRVWGETPPERARHALHVYLARIRRLLAQVDAGTEEPARLTRRGGGYALDIDPAAVDVHRFRQLVEQVRTGRCPQAQEAGLLRQALGLWRGAAMGGVEGDWAARVRQAWHQQRLEAAVRWAQAELRLGDAAGVVEPLADLLLDNPLSEPLVTAMMRALHAAGRIPQALDCYTAFRRRLADQLGLDPGEELRELHRAILNGTLGASAVPAPAPPLSAGPAESPGAGGASAAPARPQAVAPAQLPLDAHGFTGRRAELARLDAALARGCEQPTAVRVLTVSGIAGVGKTALAVHWAHRVAGRFPDGQLYVNLRGFAPRGSAMSPGEALGGFLHALAVPAARLPADVGARSALYRSLLARRRMLVVLDNARDADQVRPLLPGAPGCLALITSRNRLTGLVAAEGALPLSLEVPNPREARQLLTRRLGIERVTAEPEAVDEIVTRCARLPLALAIVAARAAERPAFPLAAFAEELREERDRLDALSAGDDSTAVRAVLSWSYRTLSPAAARLFRLLALSAGPDISMAAAASLAGLAVPAARGLLTELSAASLVTEHRPGRFTCHDLLRAYSADLARHDDDLTRETAARRLFDHYLHTAHAAAVLLNPHRNHVEVAAAAPQVTLGQVPDREQAMDWFTAEHHNLLAAVQRAGDTGCDVHAWKLAWNMAEFLQWRGHWSDRASVQLAALAATRRLGDRPGQVKVLRGLGTTYAQLGRLDEALAYLRQALELVAERDDDSRANIHMGLALALEAKGDYRAALEHGFQALSFFRAARYTTGQANALNMIGWCHSRLGDHADALAVGERALSLQRRIGSAYGQACTLDSVGYAHHHLGRLDRAAGCYRQALALFRELGERSMQAAVLTHLGETHAAAGDHDEARDCWCSALTLLDQLDTSDAVALRERIEQLAAKTVT
ncbi:AfsR/SARP family transcriptional regulator [Planobispora takensis]|uniref:SARP family transcriptional regulator n=1 Tax=Planobispora takensis TaxID=1367882 RepID=A0A8J3T4G2_9ACTN|nr:BTAD domain-containing putative transcriptional regulator [Planobispora takensis]GII04053.1 SARP family transcriptional regulator [Planobispora takensis]